MQVSVQKFTSTTRPRNSAGTSGSDFSQAVAPANAGMCTVAVMAIARISFLERWSLGVSCPVGEAQERLADSRELDAVVSDGVHVGGPVAPGLADTTLGGGEL